jgi:aconitase A
MVPVTEGGVTLQWGAHAPSRVDEGASPSSFVTSICDAASAYQQTSTPTILIGAEDYGMGSSRDWAEKSTNFLGVKAVVTKSFERIHRSNLVGMGVLPCNFVNKADYEKVKDLADVTFDIPIIVRIDTPVEKNYYRAGGILPYVLAQILGRSWRQSERSADSGTNFPKSSFKFHPPCQEFNPAAIRNRMVVISLTNRLRIHKFKKSPLAKYAIRLIQAGNCPARR